MSHENADVRPVLHTTREAARLLGKSVGAVRKSLQRRTRLAADGTIEAPIYPGVTGIKMCLRCQWGIRIDWH